MNRAEHIAWCKERALEYLDNGDIPNALNSMGSDLNKHPDTNNHIGMQLTIGLMMVNKLTTTEEVRRFIEGFN